MSCLYQTRKRDQNEIQTVTNQYDFIQLQAIHGTR